MSRIGDPDLPVVSASESDRLDRLLKQANQRRRTASQPAVSREVSREVQDRTAPMPAITPTPAPASAATDVSDDLRSISWAEQSPVAPASEPIASDPFTTHLRGQISNEASSQTPTTQLAESQREPTAQDIGRSAWTHEPANAGSSDPAGWDQMGWTDMDSDGGAGAPPPRNEAIRALREWGPVLIAAVVIALFTRLVLVQAYHIPSLSMSPTLDEGDRVIVNRLSYNFGEPERGQVIVFEKPPNQQSDANDLIKRVVGLPGETLQFRDGEVYVDEMLVEEPYLAAQDSTRPRSFSIPGCAQADPSPTECLVPDGYVFVMGDNRNGSQDSRSFGPIEQSTIVGRAFIVVWPFTDVNRL